MVPEDNIRQMAKGAIVDAARDNKLLDDTITMDAAFVEAEKNLMLMVMPAVYEHAIANGGGITADEVASVFTFVFGKAAEVVTNFANKKPNEFKLQGLFDGKTPIYADDNIASGFKDTTFPSDAAQRFWDLISTAAADNHVAILGDSLKLVFRIGCHYAVTTLESKKYRFI